MILPTNEKNLDFYTKNAYFMHKYSFAKFEKYFSQNTRQRPKIRHRNRVPQILREVPQVPQISPTFSNPAPASALRYLNAKKKPL